MLINLTPHAITILTEPPLVVEPSGTVARCAVTRKQFGTILHAGLEIPVNRSAFGAVDGLPEQAEGTYYIVSSIVAQACPERDDLFIVDDTVRDEAGRIVGCRALARV